MLMEAILWPIKSILGLFYLASGGANPSAGDGWLAWALRPGGDTSESNWQGMIETYFKFANYWLPLKEVFYFLEFAIAAVAMLGVWSLINWLYKKVPALGGH